MRTRAMMRARQQQLQMLQEQRPRAASADRALEHSPRARSASAERAAILRGSYGADRAAIRNKVSHAEKYNSKRNGGRSSPRRSAAVEQASDANGRVKRAMTPPPKLNRPTTSGTAPTFGNKVTKGGTNPTMVVASRLQKTSEELRAISNRLTNYHAQMSIGDRRLRHLRLKWGSSKGLRSIMRLEHVTARLQSARDGLKLPHMLGSEILAQLNGVQETVGDLLPGTRISKAVVTDEAFVAAMMQRRIVLRHPSFWLTLKRDGYAELEVELLETGTKLRLQLRPTAKTELVYCAGPGTPLRIVNKAETPLKPRVGMVEETREDGIPLIRFEGAAEAVPMVLCSTHFVVSPAGSPYNAEAKITCSYEKKLGVQVKVALNFCLRPRPSKKPKIVPRYTKRQLQLNSSLLGKNVGSPEQPPSPPRPMFVPELIIPSSAGHNRQPSPSETSAHPVDQEDGMAEDSSEPGHGVTTESTSGDMVTLAASPHMNCATLIHDLFRSFNTIQGKDDRQAAVE